MKELKTKLEATVGKLRQDLQSMRSSRPSIEMIKDIKVGMYDGIMTVEQLGSLAVVPPRTIAVSAWDKAAVGPVQKAIEEAGRGFSVSADGNTIRATLSALGDERREELTKTAKKSAEGARISVRAERDEAIKKLKAGEDKGELSEDDVFKLKQEAQKAVDEANKAIESHLSKKLAEFSE